MHLNDDVLRAYLDHELSAEQIVQVEAHTATCAECQERINQVRRRAQLIKSSFEMLSPGPQEMPRPSQAFYQKMINSRKETRSIMNTRRPLWTALATLIVLVLLFTLTPASAWANSFLSLFRVQKVAVVSFDPTAAQKSQELLNTQNDEIELLFQNNLNVTSEGETQWVNTFSEAADLAKFMPRLLTGEKPFENPRFTVKPKMSVEFTLDQPKLQMLIDTLEINIQLPAEVNGQRITMDVPEMVSVYYGDCPSKDAEVADEEVQPKNCTTLYQLSSPVINAPAELNVPQLGEAMFQFIGFSEEQARNLSSTIDWTSTLILPIPEGQGVSYQEISVDGVTGTLLLSGEYSVSRYSIIWTKDGKLYSLNGVGALEEAQKAVTALQ